MPSEGARDCEVEVEQGFALFEILRRAALSVWGEWPDNMRLTEFHAAAFTLCGTCPYCRVEAAFETVTSLHMSYANSQEHRAAVAKCVACHEFILAVVRHVVPGYGQGRWEYFLHHPIGLPGEKISDSIPEPIRLDFQEALKCRYVKAFNATIEMCRRALEASCLEMGAKADLSLNDMIEWIHEQGKITRPLREFAHTIKLGGNRAAHPSDRTLTGEDADAVLEFMRQYLLHVYELPARMAKVDFSKPKGPKP